MGFKPPAGSAGSSGGHLGDWADLAAGSSVKAGQTVRYGGFTWARKTDGTVGSSFTYANWVRLADVPIPWLHGVNSIHFGHSYTQYFTPPVSLSPSALYSDLLKIRRGLNSNTRRGVGGYWMQDVLGGAMGGLGSITTWQPNTANTSGGATTNQNGLVIIDGVENDMTQNGAADSKGLGGFQHSLRTLLHILFCGARLDSSDVSFTQTSGTWSTGTGQAQFNGGNVLFSTSTSAVMTVTFTGTDRVLFLGAKDSGAGGAAPGTAQVQVDGVTVQTLNLDQIHTSGGSGAGIVSAPIAVPLLGLSNAAHTVTITNTGAAGSVLYVDCIAPLAALYPTVLVMKQAYNDTYVTNGSDAAVDAYNAAIDTVIALPELAGRPIYAVDPNPSFDKATMFAAPTHARHLNDKGSDHYEMRIAERLMRLDYRHGLNILTS